MKGRRQVRGCGPATPKFICLGEGPGASEEIKGQPFVGPSGGLLMSALGKVGVTRGNVWLGNVTSCRPPGGANKDAALKIAVECCRPRLLDELKSLPDVPILLLGKYAAQAFLGDTFSITELAGTYHEIDVPGVGTRRFIPTLHPAHILRGGGEDSDAAGAHSQDLLFWNLVYDIIKVDGLARGTLVKFTDDTYTEAKDPKRAHALLERVYKAALKVGWVACDTETVAVEQEDCKDCHACNGHDARQARHAKLTAIGFATEAWGASLAWVCLWAKTKDRVKALLADPKVTKVFHNELYDRVVLRHNNMPVGGPRYCTLLAHHNAFPGLVHKLQRVASQFMCVPPWKAEFRHGKDTVENLLAYNAKDALCTARIRNPIDRALKHYKNEQSFAMDLRMSEIAEQMQEWGIPIDLKVNAEITTYLGAYAKERYNFLQARFEGEGFKKRFFEYLTTEKAKKVRKKDSDDFYIRQATRMQELTENKKKPFVFNLNARQQVSAFLLASGIPLQGVTPSGQVATGKSVLQPYFTNPTVKSLRDYTSATKLLGTFVRPLPSMVDKNCRLHPVWSPIDISGRWSSKQPGSQNWSKGSHRKLSYEQWKLLPDDDKKGMPSMRAQVVAPPGRILVAADYKALEGRIVAWLSGDPFLCDVYQKNLDSHTIVAREVFPGFDGMEKNAREKVRDDIKRMFYGGFLYGANPINTWKKLLEDGNEVELKVVVKALRSLNALMPGVARWHARLFADAIKNGEVRSALLGRRREFPLGQPEETVVFNQPVQSCAADIMDIALDKLYTTRPQHVLFLINGHDSLTVEADADKVEAVKVWIVAGMEQTHELNGISMPFTVDVKSHVSWAGC